MTTTTWRAESGTPAGGVHTAAGGVGAHAGWQDCISPAASVIPTPTDRNLTVMTVVGPSAAATHCRCPLRLVPRARLMVSRAPAMATMTNPDLPRAAIVGLGITETGKVYGRSAADFAADAARLAVADAGLDAR